MKKLFILLITFSFTITATAQVFVDTIGNIMLGDTIPTAYGHKMQVRGNAIFSDESDTSAITSAALIRANSDYSDRESPDYTWSRDNHTGTSCI